MTALLRSHILIAGAILADAKSGNSTAFAADKARWYANADDIAGFLHNANPENWPLAEMQTMMHRHLDLTLQEAPARLDGDWQGDIAAYDAVHLLPASVGEEEHLSRGYHYAIRSIHQRED